MVDRKGADQLGRRRNSAIARHASAAAPPWRLRSAGPTVAAGRRAPRRQRDFAAPTPAWLRAGRARPQMSSWDRVLSFRLIGAEMLHDLPAVIGIFQDEDLVLLSARGNAHDDVSAIALVDAVHDRSEEHTSELQSLMRISYAV